MRLLAERALQRVGDTEHRRLVEVRRDELPADRKPSTRPIGTDIAGTPARFAVAVKMSLRYISYGSVIAPIGNAVRRRRRREQHVDAAREHACGSRRAMSARTSCAFL